MHRIQATLTQQTGGVLRWLIHIGFRNGAVCSLSFFMRVAEIEADMDEVDAGIEDPEKWIPSEQMWAELYQKYPWLRQSRDAETAD